MNIIFPFYRAEVVDNEDPTKFNRVKVYIPDLMEERYDAESKKAIGIWALPANTNYGGRNDKVQNFGSSVIPPKFAWVIIFFEGGNYNTPFYFMAFNCMNIAMMPELEFPKEPSEETKDNKIFQMIEETQNNTRLPEEEKSKRINDLVKQLSPNKAHLKAILYRSFEQGRSLVFSDHEKDERTELTGKKRNYIKLGKEETDTETKIKYKKFPKFYEEEVKNTVFEIDKDDSDTDGNQSTILIDDRDGNCKILIKTYKGDYINFDTEERKISLRCKKDIHIESSEGNIYIGAPKGSVHFTAKKGDDDESGKINFYSENKTNIVSENDININSMKNININADQENINIIASSGQINMDGDEINQKGNSIDVGPNKVKAFVTGAENATQIGNGDFGDPQFDIDFEVDQAELPKPEGKRDKDEE